MERGQITIRRPILKKPDVRVVIEIEEPEIMEIVKKEARKSAREIHRLTGKRVGYSIKMLLED